MKNQHSIPSTFQSLPIQAFVYPAKKSEKGIVFVLKGLYSAHDQRRTDSWERELIDTKNDIFTFVCINTARLPIDNQTDKEAFLGKTFDQECDDIEKIFTYLFKEEIISMSVPVFFVAQSFGGTTLLGIPKVLKKIAGIIMVASGCGKSSTTDKPLLQSLYTEDRLLTPLREYSGIFMYIRGTKDTVIPKESQEKVIEAATSAQTRIVCNVLNAEHNLTFSDLRKKPVRSSLLASALDMLLTLATK